MVKKRNQYKDQRAVYRWKGKPFKAEKRGENRSDKIAQAMSNTIILNVLDIKKKQNKKKNKKDTDIINGLHRAVVKVSQSSIRMTYIGHTAEYRRIKGPDRKSQRKPRRDEPPDFGKPRFNSTKVMKTPECAGKGKKKNLLRIQNIRTYQ